jgi:hypothetical protein
MFNVPVLHPHGLTGALCAWRDTAVHTPQPLAMWDQPAIWNPFFVYEDSDTVDWPHAVTRIDSCVCHALDDLLLHEIFGTGEQGDCGLV